MLCVMPVKRKRSSPTEAASRELDAVLDEMKDAVEKLEMVREELLVSRAGAEFAQVLEQVLGDRELPEGIARRAALWSAAATTWPDEVGPLLGGGQARELLGGVSRQRLGQLVNQQRVIVLVERSGERQFPAWQFDDSGQPLAALVGAHRRLVEDGHMSSWSAASWCTHPHPELSDIAPSRWAAERRDDAQLELVARRDAARAAQ
jgi:two-component sensor histidine kinase